MGRDRILSWSLRQTQQRYRNLIREQPERCAKWNSRARRHLGSYFGKCSVQSAGHSTKGIMHGSSGRFLLAFLQLVSENFPGNYFSGFDSRIILVIYILRLIAGRTFGRLHREGLTILLAEQSIELALEVSDFATVLQVGKSVLSGTAAALAEDPQVQKAYLGTG